MGGRGEGQGLGLPCSCCFLLSVNVRVYLAGGLFSPLLRTSLDVGNLEKGKETEGNGIVVTS